MIFAGLSAPDFFLYIISPVNPKSNNKFGLFCVIDPHKKGADVPLPREINRAPSRI